MTLDKKQLQAIFFFEFKMGQKAVETTRNIIGLNLFTLI